jgi:hypothetical protein
VPFDPNGMACDFLRSAYSTTMRFVRGNPSITSPMYWYFCKSTALPLPTDSRFGSANWDSQRKLTSDLGEDATAKRRWRNGANPNVSTGRQWAGDLHYFQQGAPNVGPLPRLGPATPVDCLNGDRGIWKQVSYFVPVKSKCFVGKTCSYTVSGPPLPPVCSYCPDTTPQHYTVTLTGFIPPDDILNGTWVLTNSSLGPCTWVGGPGGRITLQVPLSPTWLLVVLDHAFFQSNQYGSSDTMCNVTHTMPTIQYDIGSGNLVCVLTPS